MGLLDKAKFWKKTEEDFGDLSDLGDFGLDDKSMQTGAGNDLGGLGDEFNLPPLNDTTKPTLPTREEVHPTNTSKQMSDQLGIKPAIPQQYPQQQYAQTQPQFQQQPQTTYPQQQAQTYQPQYVPRAGPELSDVAKEVEIMHAKLDAIKSTLDSINQRLATLERIASGDNKQQRYNW